MSRARGARRSVYTKYVFEWDPRKAKASANKDRVPFDEAVTVFLDADTLAVLSTPLEGRPKASLSVKTIHDPLPCIGTSVVLRRLSASDWGAFQAYRCDAELRRYQGWSVMSDAEARAFLDQMSTAPLFRPGEWAQIGIAEPHACGLVGDIGLYLAEDARHAEIGFTLARHAQGRGLATAAVREAVHLVFQLTTVERVRGITDARNHASIRVLERVGMSRQAQRHVEWRGESCLEYVYAVARDDGCASRMPEFGSPAP